MFWYLLNILILTVAWMASPAERCRTEHGLELKRSKLPVCVAGAVDWVLLSGLRGWSVGADTYAYKLLFERVKVTSWSALLQNFSLKYFHGMEIKDPGYPILEKLFQVFFDDYQLWLIFIALLFMVPLSVLLYRYSSHPYLSFVLYSTLFYGFFAETGHRQTIATALVVCIGLFCIQRRRLLPFLGLVAVASTIHTSAIAFLPFYWIAKVRLRKRHLWLCWAAVAASFIFRYQVLDILQALVGYEQYQDFEGAGAGSFMVLLLAFAALCSVFYQTVVEQGDTEDGVLHAAFNALMLACFFSSLLLINQNFMRVVQYYSIFLLLLLPEGAKAFTPGKSRSLYIVICTVMMLVLLIRNAPAYQFFWQ